MFCSSSPDLILSNICSITNPTVKSRNTVENICSGVAKTKNTHWKRHKPNSWFIHRLSSKFYLVDILQNPTKIKQNSIFIQNNMLSYPISLNTTKINKKPPNSFKNLNSISSKTTLTNPSFFLINKHFLRYAFSYQTLYYISYQPTSTY